jgi:hypothetical protein
MSREQMSMDLEVFSQNANPLRGNKVTICFSVKTGRRQFGLCRENTYAKLDVT